MTLGDAWLAGSYGSVPSDEQLVTAAHVAGASMFGASIACTRGVYPAELQAIARVLAMLPLSFTLHVHTDSAASIAAIRSYEEQCSERRRLRMAARPLLQLISHLLSIRHATGADIHFEHVRAHTTHTDIDSVGNRLSDWQAERSRLRPSEPRPLLLREFPLTACEPYAHLLDEGGSALQIINDARRTALVSLHSAALEHWRRKGRHEQGCFAGRASVDSGCEVLRHGSAAQQATFLHVATNCAHFHWRDDSVAAAQPIARVQCVACDESLTLDHLASCASAQCEDYRQGLRDAMLGLISKHAATRAWCNPMRHADLRALLFSLFPPLPPAPADAQQRHLTALMSGIFTRAQARSAAKSLGFDPLAHAEDGRSTLQQLRLRCLDGIRGLYAELKAAQA